MRVSVGVVVLGIFFYMGVAQAQDPQKVIKEIEDTYKKITSFQASLSMEKRREGKESKGEGKIWTKEDKFRMEMELIAPVLEERREGKEQLVKEKETIVSDGEIFWLYSNIKNQMMIIDSRKLTELPGPAKEELEKMIENLNQVPSVLSSPKFLIEKEIEMREEKWKEESFYVLKDKQTEIWVKKEVYLIYRVITYDEEGNITSSAELTEIKINEDVPDELFTVKVPEGIKPVDMVEMIKAMYEGFKEKE